MPAYTAPFRLRVPGVVALLMIALVAAISPRLAQAEALLLIEADTGKVLQAENATYPWYPASVTKLMTAYTILKAVKEGRITLDTLFTVSPIAAAQQPSKMGFRPGTQVTVDNALKMMMVKSANDIAVVLAEGLSGSIDNFADEMNKNAQRLGMTQTHYVNPNGLPAEGHVTSARDLGILARAIFHDLPEYDYFMHIPAIKFGRRVTANFNKLIGRYPGADGMKTGFICASGFNLVASATRNNKRLIAVVLGAQSSAQRAMKAAQLLERGFNGNRLSWLRPSLGTVDSLAPIDATPPNLKEDVCGPKRKRPPAEDEDDDVEVSTGTPGDASNPALAMFAAGLQPPSIKASELLAQPAAPVTPVIVYTGPTRTGTAVQEADAAESAKQQAEADKGKKKKGSGRPRIVSKPDVTQDAKGDKKTDTKSGKPVAKTASTDQKTKPVPPAPVAKPPKPAGDKKHAETKPQPKSTTVAKDGPKGSKPAAQQKSDAPRS